VHRRCIMTSQVMDRISEDKWTIQRAQKFCAPIHALPLELLCRIFLHCVSNDLSRSRRNSIRGLSKAPLLLGRVCSGWRNVSISSPELWSSFAVGNARHK
ncbi:hypothetical protein BD410DRAFT_731171, partial [Rickenella mellea]